MGKKRHNYANTPIDFANGPSAQKQAYGYPQGLKGTNPHNSQLVFGTGSYGYDVSDIDMFFSIYAPNASSANVSFDSSNVWKSGDGEGQNFDESARY